MGETFTIKRIELKKMLVRYGISDKSVDELEANLNRMHRHVNAVAFAGMMQKLGLGQANVINVLRRIGIDDVTITNVLNMLDEERISAAFGKVIEIGID